MDLLPGIVGGVIAVALLLCIQYRVKRMPANGEIRRGVFMFGLGMAFAVITIVFAYILIAGIDGWGSSNDRVFDLVLFAVMAASALYFLLEFFTVRGRYDATGIQFQSIWSGKRCEVWENLASVEHNELASWHRLVFNNGASIRISTLMGGHQGVMDIISTLGSEFDLSDI